MSYKFCVWRGVSKQVTHLYNKKTIAMEKKQIITLTIVSSSVACCFARECRVIFLRSSCFAHVLFRPRFRVTYFFLTYLLFSVSISDL